MYFKVTANLLAILVGLALPVQGQILLWDGTDQSTTINSNTAGTSIGNWQPFTLGSYNTERYMYQVLTDVAAPGSVAATIVGSSNILDINDGIGDASTVDIHWGDELDDLNMDLTGYGDAFSFDYIAGDASAVGTQIYMSISNDFTTYYSHVITLTSATTTPIHYAFSFTDFGAADLANVDRIGFHTVMPTSADATFANMQIDPITPVPEPAGACLIGIAGILLIVRRRKAV